MRTTKMKSPWVLKLILLTLVGASAQADEAEDYVYFKGKIPKPEKTSAQNREDKTFTAAFQPLGTGPSYSGSRALSAGYFIKPDSLVVGEFTWNTQNVLLFGPAYKVKGGSVGVHYKQFFGNTFYGKAGLDYRVSEVKFRSESLHFPGQTIERRIEGDSVAVSVAVGNQWQFENFTVGCDWIGYVKPVVSDIKNESISTNVADYHKERQDEDKKLLFSQGIAQSLRIYLGASF